MDVFEILVKPSESLSGKIIVTYPLQFSENKVTSHNQMYTYFPFLSYNNFDIEIC